MVRYSARYWTLQEQGSRNYMEDRSFVVVDPSKTWLQAGVFDGHGGTEVSAYCNYAFLELGNDLHKSKALGMEDRMLRDKVKAFYEKQDKALEKTGRGYKAGSTVIHAYLDLANEGRGCFSCLGDSKLIVFDQEGTSLLSSQVHKYEKNDQEKKRIAKFMANEPDIIRTSTGESIKGVDLEKDKLAKNKIWRLRGRLAMTRSLGDLSILSKSEIVERTKRPLISIPDVYRFKPPEGTETIYLVLCSDGLTDVLTDEEIAETVLNHDPRILAIYPSPVQRLVDAARIRANQYNLNDNMTIIVIKLEAMDD